MPGSITLNLMSKIMDKTILKFNLNLFYLFIYMDHQDFKILDIGKHYGSNNLTNEELTIQKRNNMRKGLTKSYTKTTTQKNTPENAKKLDESTEATKIEKIKYGKEIMTARTARKLNRKQLAQLLNVKIEIVSAFENNSVLATPANKKILNKIKQKLGIK